MSSYKPKSHSKLIGTRFLVRHKLIQRCRKERGLESRLEWYTANHLANVFSKGVLRDKIMAFSPTLLARPIKAEDSLGESSRIVIILLHYGMCGSSMERRRG